MLSGFDPGGDRFIPGSLEMNYCSMTGVYDPGMEPFPPRVPLASRTPANQQSAIGVGLCTSCGTVSIRGSTVFVPGLLKLLWYGNISDLGMGPYNTREPLASLTPANQLSANRLGISTPCGAVSTHGTIVFFPSSLEL